MIRAMSEQDEAPASFFFPGAAQVEPVPATGTDETASTTTPSAEPIEPAASAEPVTAALAEPAAWTAPAEPATEAAPAGSAGDTAESFSVVNPDGSTTTRLPDGSFQTVVRLPGGATIVTSTQPPGAPATPASADEPRGRRWRIRDR
jgi:hypothetical protein